MNKKFLTQIAVTLTVAVSAQAQNLTESVIAQENVPIEIKADGLTCKNKVPDHGFGAVPGSLSVSPQKVFDRTLRVSERHYLRFILPDDVSCGSLAEALAKVPKSLVAVRTVLRSSDEVRTLLKSQLEVALLMEVHSKPVVLTAEDSWIERTKTTQSVPSESEYRTRIHPQAASQGYGLHCEVLDFSNIGTLSQGGVGGHAFGNVNVVERLYENAQVCQDVHARLLKTFEGMDPENWGTIVKVKRKLRNTHRYILDNEAKPTCQEIQLEEVELDLEGVKMFGAKSFPIRTVAMERCGS